MDGGRDRNWWENWGERERNQLENRIESEEIWGKEERVKLGKGRREKREK